MVALVPLVGQAIAGAEGVPVEITERPVMEVILLLTLERAELSTTLIASTMVGAAQSDEVSSMEAEVTVAMMDGS